MRTHAVMRLVAALSFCLILGACDRSDENQISESEDALTLEQLELAVVHVAGFWSEIDPLFDDIHQWGCSAGVLSGSDEQLLLVTSSMCLGLNALVESDTNAPDLGGYKLTVTFAGKQTLGVTHIGETHKGLGISLLAIDNPRLAEGTAYVSLKQSEDKKVAVGNEVVAVIQRGKLSGNHMFGHVTALRELEEHASSVQYIQTDLQLQREDDGGPLFAEASDRYRWIGVNTTSEVEGQEMAFAISAKEIDVTQFEWFTADGAGVVQLLDSIYGIEAQLE